MSAVRRARERWETLGVPAATHSPVLPSQMLDVQRKFPLYRERVISKTVCGNEAAKQRTRRIRQSRTIRLRHMFQMRWIQLRSSSTGCL